MARHANNLSRRYRAIPVIALGTCLAALAATAAAAQTPPPAILQVIAASGNEPDSQHTIIQGQVYFDPNTQILGYCLSSADTKVSETCATANLSTILSSGDTGPAGGRVFDLRVDAGQSGSLVEAGGHLVPLLDPSAIITRVATVDQSYDGQFAFALTIARSGGQFVPVIGGNF
jgi:hypothetical protein